MKNLDNWQIYPFKFEGVLLSKSCYRFKLYDNPDTDTVWGFITHINNLSPKLVLGRPYGLGITPKPFRDAIIDLQKGCISEIIFQGQTLFVQNTSDEPINLTIVGYCIDQTIHDDDYSLSKKFILVSEEELQEMVQELKKML